MSDQKTLAALTTFLANAQQDTSLEAGMWVGKQDGWLAFAMRGSFGSGDFPTFLPPFDDEATDRETIAFLRDFIKYTQPTQIIEAGTYKGHFALSAAFASHVGMVYTADPTNYGIPELITRNMRSNIVYFETTFAEMCKNDALRYGADFAFVDSGGRTAPADTRINDYRLAKTLIRPGGFIATHDTNGLWDGRDEILAEASLVFPINRGLALYQMPK